VGYNTLSIILSWIPGTWPSRICIPQLCSSPTYFGRSRMNFVGGGCGGDIAKPFQFRSSQVHELFMKLGYDISMGKPKSRLSYMLACSLPSGWVCGGGGALYVREPANIPVDFVIYLVSGSIHLVCQLCGRALYDAIVVEKKTTPSSLLQVPPPPPPPPQIPRKITLLTLHSHLMLHPCSVKI
jgi:hypothetical protein